MPINLNVDGLEVGTHTYTIVVTDSSGNEVSDTVEVTVIAAVKTTTTTTTVPKSSPGFLSLLIITSLGFLSVKRKRRPNK